MPQQADLLAPAPVVLNDASTAADSEDPGDAAMSEVELDFRILQLSSGTTQVLNIALNNVDVKGIVDTGAEVTAVPRRVFARFDPPVEELAPTRLRLASSDNYVDGVVTDLVTIHVGDHIFNQHVVVVDTCDEVIIGLDFLKAQNCKIDFEQRSLLVDGTSVALHDERRSTSEDNRSASPTSILCQGHPMSSVRRGSPRHQIAVRATEPTQQACASRPARERLHSKPPRLELHWLSSHRKREQDIGHY